VGSVSAALGLIAKEQRIDGAVLDVNLAGDRVYPVAEALRARHVPFVFATGYDDGLLDERFSDVERFQKPVNVRVLLGALAPRAQEI
jgi:hypothetical protein